MPPPGYEPFLRAICADPEDDTVRLVYADWLDENGDPDRAEFIRLQVAVPERPQEYDARYARAEELRKKNWETWFGELPKLSGVVWNVQFQRGFVSGVRTDRGKRLCYQHERIFEATPVQFLTVNDAGQGSLERVLQLPEVDRLCGLSLRSCRIAGGQWGALAECPRLSRLRWLSLDGPFVASGRFPALDADDARALVDSVCLPRLESIRLSGPVDPAVLAVLRTRFKVR